MEPETGAEVKDVRPGIPDADRKGPSPANGDEPDPERRTEIRARRLFHRVGRTPAAQR